MESANNSAVSENVDSINMNLINSEEKEAIKNFTDNSKQTIETLLLEIDAKLKAGQLDEAVELFGSFMEQTIAKYEGDDLNPLLAENYARYGSLLLRLAIRNNDHNVLSAGNAATAGTPETTEALLQATVSGKKKLIEFSGDEDDEEIEETSELQDDKENDQVESQEQERDQEKVDSDDDDDFTIAWENLDVARLLFEKRIEICLDVSEKSALNRALGFVYQDLGDLSLENENFADAISEYELALKCFGTPTIETLRDLAGIYFNLALSMEFENKLVSSKAMYLRTKELLQQKESYLLSQELVDEKASESLSLSPELEELKGLISEINLKIDDLETNNQSIMSQELQDATNKAALSAAQNINGAVNDISGMIKKRKVENVEVSFSKEAKIETTEGNEN